MKSRVAVRATANFERNLAAIRALVSRLEGVVIPGLERFPDIGATFTGKAPLSHEGRVLFERLVELSGTDGEIRQLVEDDYVLLYLHRGSSVFLLSIKHHRQLSFDLAGHWPG